VPAHPQVGFVKIAFTYAFQHLLSGSNYLEAISTTLLRGGDTDTNACIVGGLLGTACGAESIPDEMRNAVVNCDTADSSHPRPDFLSTRQIPLLMEGLIPARDIEE